MTIEPTELVNKINNIHADSINLVNTIGTSLQNKKINFENVKSVIDVVSDFNFIKHDLFNFIKHGKDTLSHLDAIYKKNYDFHISNVINTIDTFCELGQLSIKYLAKNLVNRNLFSKILDINQTGHYIIASQIIWNINKHTIKEALSFTPTQRTEWMTDFETYPTLFDNQDIKKFIQKNKNNLNVIIRKTQNFMQKEIRKNNDNFPELASIDFFGGSKKTKTKRMRMKRKKSSKKRKQKRK
jgi:hypothetical protein